MNACWAVLIYSSFPISLACLRRKQSKLQFNHRIQTEIRVSTRNFKTVLKRKRSQISSITQRQLLSFYCQEIGELSTSYLLYVCASSDKHAVTWEEHAFPLQADWAGELHVAAAGKKSPLSGRGCCRDQLSLFVILLSYLPRWRAWVWPGWDSSWEVTSRISLISSPSSLFFGIGTRVQWVAPSWPLFPAHWILWSWLLQPRIPCPVFFPHPDLKSSSGNSHLAWRWMRRNLMGCKLFCWIHRF